MTWTETFDSLLYIISVVSLVYTHAYVDTIQHTNVQYERPNIMRINTVLHEIKKYHC